MNDFVRTHGETVVPFTTDYLIDNFKDFVKKGDSLFPGRNFLKFIGDATHDKTSQGLKKLVLGVACTHFSKGKLQNTVLPIMYAAISQESKSILKTATDALITCIQQRLGFNLADKVEEWYWDGAPEAMAVLSEQFPGIIGHMCLQYAKPQWVKRFSGGFKHYAIWALELTAFMPNPTFHLSIEAMLARLDAAGQTKGVKYLRTANSPCALEHSSEGVWSARWQSSFQHVQPGFSTFLNNSVESGWAVAQLVNGKTKHEVTSSMFNNVRRACKVWVKDQKLAQTEHMPCGLLRHQPSLLRGNGLVEPKTCL